MPRNASQGHLKAILEADSNIGIFLFGPGGTGKTHFLAAMYNYADSKHKRVKYLEDSMLKDELRNAELNNDFCFAYDLVNDYDCIFIDDVGKAVMTQFHRSALWRFFNEAYKHKRQIFITSNDSLSILGSDDYWGSHVARRVEALCQPVQF